MLHFLIGVGGTGKSKCLMQKIEQTLRSGQKAILLVPEQLSFESERQLYRLLGPTLSLNLEVLSFTRLCHAIFRTTGGLAQTAITPTAKYLLMSVVVSELEEHLHVYQKNATNPNFLKTLLQACADFKTAGIRPDKLDQVSQQCAGTLSDKLKDLSFVYTAYQGLLEQEFTDPDDNLIRACALLELHTFFQEYAVFVDGFTTFMAAEFELLTHVIVQSPTVWFSMTCDQVTDTQKGMGVFSPVQSAIKRLTRTAQSHGILVDVEVASQKPIRYRHTALEHLACHYFMPRGAVFTESAASAIQLYTAAHPYDEIEYVAASIMRLIQDEGYRFREIAVVARNTDSYLRAIQMIFPRYGIPFFSNLPIGAENHPLIAGQLYAMDAICNHWNTESILLLAKSPLLGLSIQSVACLENYCYCWDIQGSAWEKNFTANPRGLEGALSSQDTALLDQINAVRQQILEPLLHLKTAIDTGMGKTFATGIYEYLMEVYAPASFHLYAQDLPQEETTTFLHQTAQIWENLMDILHVFGTVFGEIKMQPARLCALFRLALTTLEIALPPQTLDQVLIGQADRIRPLGVRAVFVIGAVEGKFPAQGASSGIFSDTEQEQLIQAGAEISLSTLERSVLERFFAYHTLTLASEHVFMSYPRAELTGEHQLPSILVTQLKMLFPQLEPFSLPVDYCAVGEKAAFDLLSREYGKNSVLEATLQAYFLHSNRDDTLQRMDSAFHKPRHQLTDPSLALGLFGKQIRLSSTKIEQYYQCPFRFFMDYGLGIRPRQKVEFSRLESGKALHYVLQMMVQQYGGKGLHDLSDAQLHADIEQLILRYLQERLENIQTMSARFRYLFRRLSSTLTQLIRRLGEEYAQSAFTPYAVELSIAQNKGVPPLLLETEEGIQVVVEGKVDRVDWMEKDGCRYIRVVDYKSGSKKFALADVLYGINMQMLLYLFTIQENGTEDLADTRPAGVLYMPVVDEFIPAGRDTPLSQVQQMRNKQWCMSGLLLEDEAVLTGMEQALAGVFIPVEIKKDELYSKSSLIGKAEMEMLAQKVQSLVLQMASALSQGNICAVPTNSAGQDVCSYCQYRTVCGRESEDPMREIPKMEIGDVLKQLREEQTDG